MYKTHLALERVFLLDVLQILLKYSEGLRRVSESAALANFGGINGSTMCLCTRCDTWFGLVSSESFEDGEEDCGLRVIAAGISVCGGCGCSEEDVSDLLVAVPQHIRIKL